MIRVYIHSLLNTFKRFFHQKQMIRLHKMEVALTVFIFRIFKGYSLDNLPEYSTGDIRDSEKAARKMLPCVKWGAKTGFTKGLLCLKGTAARWIEKPISHTNLFSQTSIMYYNQLEIEGMSSTSFALPGDSGALVFQIDPAETEKENHQLYCIGMVVGGVPKVNTIVTPIQPILDAFQVQMHKFTPERMDDT